MNSFELQLLSRIEQLIRDITTKPLQSSFYINRAGTTSASANQFTLLAQANAKRLNLFIQNPTISPVSLLIRLLDKDGQAILVELAPGSDFQIKLENNYVYTGEVSVSASLSSICYYAYEVERL